MNQQRVADDKFIVLGHISGVHGVKGWVRLYSHTEPREAILDYSPWLLGAERRAVIPLEGAQHGKKIVARLDGISSRDGAEALVGLEIGIERSQMPDPGDDRFYWADLIGLNMVSQDGATIGTLRELMATGANDVMVVQAKDGGERLIPFILGQTVLRVDLENSEIVVRWEEDF
jgi:16S rRNA processing protein RimM